MKKIILLTCIIIIDFLLANPSFGESKIKKVPLLQYDYRDIVDSVVFTYNQLTDSQFDYSLYPLNIVPEPGRTTCFDTYYEGKVYLLLEIGKDNYHFGTIANLGSIQCSITFRSFIGTNRKKTFGPKTLVLKDYSSTNGDNLQNIQDLCYFDDINILYDNLGNLIDNFKISSITFTGGSSLPAGIKDSIRLKFFYTIEKKVKIDCSVKPIVQYYLGPVGPLCDCEKFREFDLSLMEPTESVSSQIPFPGMKIFNWENPTSCQTWIKSVQIQILRLYNEEPLYAIYPKKCRCVVDWSKALTIETDNLGRLEDYIITEGTGFYIWRIRYIGNYYDGGISNDRNWGCWNTNMVIKEPSQENYCDPIPPYQATQYESGDIFDTEGSRDLLAYYIIIDESKNWKHTRAYTENPEKVTNYHDAMEYADNLLNIRQTEKRIPLIDPNNQPQNDLVEIQNKITVLQQNILDYNSRPSIQTLPVPVKDGSGTGGKYTGIKYRDELISSSGSLYQAKDFDLNPSNAYSINTGSLLDEYYDGDNIYGTNLGTDYKLPTANQYPLVRQLYMNDGTNRVKEQGQPGDILKAIPDHFSDIPRTIRTSNEQATEEELLPVFGEETPDTKTITKILTTDQNQITSVTYKDMAGNTIATCLKKNNNENQQLDNLTETPLSISSEYNIKGMEKQGNKYIASRIINITEPYSANVDVEFSSPLLTISLSEIPCVNSERENIDYTIILDTNNLDLPTNDLSRNNSDAYKTFNTPSSFTETITVLNGKNEFKRTLILTHDLEYYLDHFKTNVKDTYQGLLNKYLNPIYDKIEELKEQERQGNFNVGNLDEFYKYLHESYYDLSDPPLHYVWNINTQGNYYILSNYPDFNCLDTLKIPKFECSKCEIYQPEKFEEYLTQKYEDYVDKNNNKLFNSINDFFYSDGKLTFDGAPSGVSFKTIIEHMFSEIQNGDSIYPVGLLCSCWTGLVENFEGNGIITNESTGAKSINKNYNLLEDFFNCVGKMYKGISNHKFGAEDLQNNIYGDGFIEFGYKYFEYTKNNSDVEKASFVQKVDFSTHPPTTTFYQFNSEINTISYTFDDPGPFDDPSTYNKRWEFFFKNLESSKLNKSDIADKIREGAKNENVSNEERKHINDLLDAMNRGDRTATLTEFLANLQSDCEKGCEKRIDEFKTKLIYYFHEKGFVVEGDKYWVDPEDPNNTSYEITGDPLGPCFTGINVIINSVSVEKEFITMEMIDEYAENIVLNCQNKCVVSIVGGLPNQAQLENAIKMMRKPKLEIVDCNDTSQVNDEKISIKTIYRCSYLKRNAKNFVEKLNNKLNEIIYNNYELSFQDWNLLNKRYEVCSTLHNYLSDLLNDFNTHLLNRYIDNISSRICDDNINEPHLLLNYSNYNGNGPTPINEFSKYKWKSNIWDIKNIHLSENWRTTYGTRTINQPNINSEICISDFGGEMFPAFVLRNNYNATGNDIHYSHKFVLGDLIGDCQIDNFRNDYSEVETRNSCEGPCFVPIIFETKSLYPNNGYYYHMELEFAYLEARCWDCGKNFIDLCINWDDEIPEPSFEDVTVRPKTCLDYAIPNILRELNTQYESILDEKLQNTENLITQEFNDALQYYQDNETYIVRYSNNYYHYTLYYFDRAGNPVKTVPPKGVQYLTTPDRATPTSHTFQTEYEYNSLGQMISTTNPDHDGYTFFVYNKKGQLRFSQNPKQANLTPQVFSFYKYDYLGRLIAQGEMEDPNVLINTNYELKYLDLKNKADIDDSYPNVSTPIINPPTLPIRLWIHNYITTVYSEPNPNLSSLAPYTTFTQKNLRNRVSYTTRVHDVPLLSSITNYLTSMYSYDLHGNVEWMIQDNHIFEVSGHDFVVKTDYEYDLISGKVNKVIFNKGRTDEYFHKYNYDSDNRLLSVETSRHNEIWDKDAKYFYYPHGPLRRIEMGEDGIQGIDYTYTIDGKLKAINNLIDDGSTMSANSDPGLDGSNASYSAFPVDGFAEKLYYFDGDFQGTNIASEMNVNFPDLLPPQNIRIKQLYNGNISAIQNGFGTSTVLNLTNNFPKFNYEYDVLNRLLFTHDDTLNPMFDEYFTYDPNGNLLTQFRQSNANYSYNYSSGTNKLTKISGTTPQFTYDEIGELKSDVTDPDFTTTFINWTQDGKIDSIKQNFLVTKFIPAYQPSTNVPILTREIKFRYDSQGNRIAKLVNSNNIPNAYDIVEFCTQDAFALQNYECTECLELFGLKNTYYAREANGQVLAVYEDGNQMYVTCGNFNPDMHLSNWNIYGSESHGLFAVRKPDTSDVQKVWITTDPLVTNLNWDRRVLGSKEYEMKDHLGNVRLVFSDRKTPANLTNYAPYTLEVRSLNNYYSFGSLQSGQSYESGKSRYGFNGMEMDNEIGITGKSYTTEFREYNSDISRWWSLDPKPTASESWYVGMGNNPILFTDFRGDSIIASQEGFDIANEGFKSTLGDKSPFYYNEKAGKIEANSYNPADFSDKQNEIITRTTALINNEMPITLFVVDKKFQFCDTKLNETKLENLGISSASGASGACIRRFNDETNPYKITSMELYVDKNQTPTFIDGLVDNVQPRGLIFLHEADGHGYNFLNYQFISPGHIEDVKKFENDVRSIYKTGKYGIEGLFQFKLPGSDRILGGKSIEESKPETK